MKIEIIKILQDDLSNEDVKAYEANILLNRENVGWVEFVDENDDITISDFVIHEEYRNKGIGSAVLKQFINDYYSVTLSPDNEDALRLYERLGFEEMTENVPEIDQGFGVYTI